MPANNPLPAGADLDRAVCLALTKAGAEGWGPVGQRPTDDWMGVEDVYHAVSADPATSLRALDAMFAMGWIWRLRRCKSGVVCRLNIECPVSVSIESPFYERSVSALGVDAPNAISLTILAALEGGSEMGETKLTADGVDYALGYPGKAREYVWLDRAQAAVDAAEQRAERAERMLLNDMKTRTERPDFRTFVELKHGPASTILWALQNGEISRGKAAEALAEWAHGVEPLLPESPHATIPDDVTPLDLMRERDEALADARYWESVIDDIGRIVKPPESEQSKGGAVTDAVERAVKDRDEARERWRVAEEQAREAAGHEFGLWPLGAIAALAAAQEENARLRLGLREAARAGRRGAR